MHLHSNSFLIFYINVKGIFKMKTLKKIIARLRPSTFSSISAIFDLHLSQLQVFLHRMNFTEAEYRSQSIPLSWSSLKSLVLKATLNWTVIFLLFLLLVVPPSQHSLLTGFTLVFGKAFELTHSEVQVFAFAYAGTFLLNEDAALYSLHRQLAYQNSKLELIYEFRAVLDWQLSRGEIQGLISYFARYHFLARLCCRSVHLGTILLASRLLLAAIELLICETKAATFLQIIFGFGLSVAASGILCHILHLLFILLTGLFFIVKILKTKFETALRMLGQLEGGRRQLRKGQPRTPLFSHFHSQYLEVHRRVLWYNEMVQKYILDMELCSKVFTSTVIIFMAKRGRQVNVFLFLLLAFYLVIYLYNINNQIRLSYFQTANEEVYRRLATLSGKMAAINLAIESRKHLHFRLKLSQAVEFSSRNRFGFTMGRAYLLNRNRVIESCILNVYILALIAENKLDV